MNKEITDLLDVIESHASVSETASQEILDLSEEKFAKHKARTILSASEDTSRLINALRVYLEEMNKTN